VSLVPKTRQFWLDPAVEPTLRSAGCDRFNVLMEADLGHEIKAKPGLSVRRLPAGSSNGGWILKRSLLAPPVSKWRQLARSIRRRERPHCEAFHVWMVAGELGAQGFPVMRVVAAGETRLLGFWPVRAFMLAELVPGTDASQVYVQGTQAERVCLMTALGALMGRLHDKGYFFTLRLHDVFCEFVGHGSVPAVAGDARLTLIDLDFRGRPARPEPSTLDRRWLSLAKACHESLRSGLRLDLRGLSAWWRSYRRTLAVADRRDFMRRVQGHTAHLTALHHADARKAAGFPDALAAGHPSLVMRPLAAVRRGGAQP
jgi:hypothetical protein